MKALFSGQVTHSFWEWKHVGLGGSQEGSSQEGSSQEGAPVAGSQPQCFQRSGGLLGAVRVGGFLLLEVMLAVVIFALGMLALGRCVRETLRAEGIRREEERASRVLANALAQVESGALKLGSPVREPLKGMYEGMELRVSREPLKEKNEKNQDLSGLYRVKLEVTWEKGGEQLSRELTFYHAPRS